MKVRRLATVVLVLLSTLTTIAGAQSSNFNVLVLDALDGKPQSGAIVRYFCEGLGWNPQNEAKTGLNGIAEVPYQCQEGLENITVDVPGEAKGECGGLGALKLSDILAKGIISEPNGAGGYWCPTKQRHKLKPVPGQVTVFVKKPTWWQSHVAG
jgi:hypothetical protein